MNYKRFIFFAATFLFCVSGFAQSDNFKPASTNQPGKQYPQVNSEGQVRASIAAPGAQKVQLGIGGKEYDMVKDEKGVWTGESLPRDEGFHYYELNIDGV